MIPERYRPLVILAEVIIFLLALVALSYRTRPKPVDERKELRKNAHRNSVAATRDNRLDRVAGRNGRTTRLVPINRRTAR